MISRDEVIELAREAGSVHNYGCNYSFTDANLERFAAACYRKGVENAANNCIESCCNDLTDDEIVRNIRALLDHSVNSNNMEVA